MQKNVNTISNIKELFHPILGLVQAKHYFSSYYGLFKNKNIFALYKEGKLFLKCSDKHLREIESIEETYQLKDPILRLNTDNFYYIPSHSYNIILQNSYWLAYVSEVPRNNEKRIRNLTNMNLNLERLLNRNGIKTIQDLFSLGEIEVFVRLIKNGEDINEMLLFKLYGAIKHKIVYSLTDNEKRTLLLEADKALYSAGLRKRFQKKY